MFFVSGFISGVNSRNDRTIEKYIDLGKTLIDSNIPLILFLEKSMATHFFKGLLNVYSGICPINTTNQNSVYASSGMEINQDCCEQFVYGGKHFSFVSHFNKNPNQYLILFEKEDLYFWNYQHLATSFHVETENPEKDSLPYFIVQIQKLEWMRIAIHFIRSKLKPDADITVNKKVGWIDFGIAHLFDKPAFKGAIENIYSKCNQNGMVRGEGRIRFASCREWKPDNPVVWALDIYTHVKWVIAGGIFLGWPEDVEKLAGIFYERCFRVLIEKRTLMWEVNILALLWQERPELFELYPSNHNSSIIDAIGTPIPCDWIDLSSR